jgi:hypothetical protein
MPSGIFLMDQDVEIDAPDASNNTALTILDR